MLLPCTRELRLEDPKRQQGRPLGGPSFLGISKVPVQGSIVSGFRLQALRLYGLGFWLAEKGPTLNPKS